MGGPFLVLDPLKCNFYMMKMCLIWFCPLGFCEHAAESEKDALGRRRWKLKSEITADTELMGMLHEGLSLEERICAHEFFLTLAACNTVIPILSSDSSSSGEGSDLYKDFVAIDYQGESPDEQALVTAASAYGYTLFERTSGHIAIDVDGEKLR